MTPTLEHRVIGDAVNYKGFDMSDTNLAVIIIGGGLLIACAVLPFMLQVARAKGHKKFFQVLWKDQETRMSNTISPAAIFPKDLEESLEMFYPELPSLDKCLKMSPRKLGEMVEWTIDPRLAGWKIDPKKIKHREIKQNRAQRRRNPKDVKKKG